ncbi:MAG: hypothetical protein WA947_08065 [Phormidesmis sp.]
MAFNQDNYSRANDAIAAINRQAGNDNKFRRAIASWGAWGSGQPHTRRSRILNEYRHSDI